MVLSTPLHSSLAVSSISVSDRMLYGKWEGVNLGLKKILMALVMYSSYCSQ